MKNCFFESISQVSTGNSWWINLVSKLALSQLETCLAPCIMILKLVLKCTSTDLQIRSAETGHKSPITIWIGTKYQFFSTNPCQTKNPYLVQNRLSSGLPLNQLVFEWYSEVRTRSLLISREYLDIFQNFILLIEPKLRINWIL